MKTEVAITAEETGESLHDKLAKAGAALCVETLERLQDGTLKPEKQGESPTPYAKMLDKKDGQYRLDPPGCGDRAACARTEFLAKRIYALG